MSAPYRASLHPYSLSPSRLKWSQQQVRLPIPIPSVYSNVPCRLMFDPPSSRHPQPTVPDVVPALRMTFHLHHVSLSHSGPIPDLLPQAASQRPPHTPSWQIPPTGGDVTPTDDGAATSPGVLRLVMLLCFPKPSLGIWIRKGHFENWACVCWEGDTDVLDARSSESREGRACGWQYDEGDHQSMVCNPGISM